MIKSVKMLKGEELEIGTTDKHGNQLKQSDFVVAQDDFEGISICQILYNGITKEFVAMKAGFFFIRYSVGK
jgi:hypothetical protein